jgi:hypothetical protein
MMLPVFFTRLVGCFVALALVTTGCTKALVKDDVRQTVSSGKHCSGSEWTNDSSLAVLPVPVVAFFVPHFDLHEIKADDYLKRCGESTNLVNRTVEVDRTACIPLGLTRIITLGVFQYCTARVSWDADLKN